MAQTQQQPLQLAERLAERLAASGVDVCTPLALSWYNDSIPAELGARIPARGAAGEAALAVLVGNSRAIWEPFLEACARQGLLEGDNPLEAYLEQAVCSALAACAPGLKHRLYWSHRRTGDLVPGPEGASEHVAFQRMAHHAGLAYLDEGSHLCLHPRFGPWFSLRCVAIFDDLPLAAPQPPALPNPLPAATQQYVRMTLKAAVHNTSKKFAVPEVDVEAAEAVCAEAACDPLLEAEEGQEQEEEQRAGSSAMSQAGSEQCASAGSTPACSSGGSSPRAGLDAAAASPAGPDELVASAASRLAAAKLVAEPVAVPAGSGAQAAPLEASPAASGSPGDQAGSLGSSGSRRSSLEREGRPSMAAVAKNWQAWVAVRDSPCPGHPMRYSEEQITYHYTRDRTVLTKALLRRGFSPRSAVPLPASGLLDPAYASFHAATMEAQKALERGAARYVAEAEAAAITAP